jgi:TRAP-type C4-dicarboxylate transport system permease small subunit
MKSEAGIRDEQAVVPDPPSGTMRRAVQLFYRFLQVLLTLLMVGLLVPVTMQVLSRYTPIVPRYIWTEEIARFCFVWIVMIGAMIAVRDGTHFDVDLLPHSKKPRVEALARLFVHLMIGVSGVLFLVYGYDFAILGSRQVSEIAGLPMLSIYIAWPLAGLVWLIFLIERVADDWALFRRGNDR